MNETANHTVCTAGHMLPAGAAFCPACGSPAAQPPQDSAPTGASADSTPAATGQPSAAEELPKGGRATTPPPERSAGAKQLDVPGLVVGLLVVSVLTDIVSFSISGPRLVYYVMLVGGAVVVLSRATEFTGRTVAVAVGAGVASFVMSDYLVVPLMWAPLGWDLWGPSLNLGRMLATAGAPVLALAVVAALVPRAREGLVGFFRPAPPAWDALRFGVLVVLVALSLVTTVRSMTEWRPFHTPISYMTAECMAGVDERFPDALPTDRSDYIEYCVDRTK